jgi:uncharacterized membrane protein YraQ (UPF0718 family)
VAALYEFLDFFFDIYFSIRSVLRGTYTEQILSNAWALFVELWPYVLLGSFAAVIIAQAMSNTRIRRFLTRRGHTPIIVASILGVFSPLCTFAAIPLAGGLLAAGVPLPPLMAFMIASPLINPSLFIITWGVMGPEMAFARTLSAFLLGVTGGWFIELALSRRWNGFTEPLRSEFTVNASLPGCSLEGDSPALRLRVLTFLRHSVKMTLFISKYFILALFLAGAVQALIKPQWIAALLGGSGFTSVLLGGLLGIPLYVCGGGTAALIGVLVSMGMGQGAALAFFITGPATKISTILSLNAVLRKRVAAVYLAVTLLGGVLIGWGYSHIAPELKIDPVYYGQIESKEDAVNFKRGIGSPQGE